MIHYSLVIKNVNKQKRNLTKYSGRWDQFTILTTFVLNGFYSAQKALHTTLFIFVCPSIFILCSYLQCKSLHNADIFNIEQTEVAGTTTSKLNDLQSWEENGRVVNYTP